MDSRLSPLLRRSSLLPGESLASFTLRLAMLNHYDPLAILRCVCTDGLVDQDSFLQPTQAATFERLAALTGIGSGELYAAGTHVFAAVLTPPDVEVETLALPGGEIVPALASGIAAKQLRPQSAAQFCPVCVREAPYHRLAWTPIAATVCLEHLRVLVGECPRCRKPISVRAVVNAACGRCGASLASMQSDEVENDAFGVFAQRVFQAWFMGAPAPINPNYPLPGQSPRALYRVLDGLRCGLLPVRTMSNPAYLVHSEGERSVFPDNRRKPTPAQGYALYAAAFSGIVNWPIGFHDFLWRYRLRDDTERGGLYGDLGTIYSQWLEGYWRHPAFRFVQEAFEQYLAERYAGQPSVMKTGRYRDNPELAERFTYATLAEAARLLRSTPGVVKRLAQMGLVAFKEVDWRRTRKRVLVLRADVLKLRRRWDEAIPLAETVEWLGVSEAVVLDLVRVGLLVTERGPGADGSARWMFGRQAIGDSLAKVAEHAVSTSFLPRDLVGLAAAARILAVVGLDAAGAVKRVADGKLRGYYPLALSPGLGDLRFSEADARACIAAIKAENGWIEREEIARQMGVKDVVVSKWVKAGLLAPTAVCAGARYFDREAVERFVAGHVFTKEAAQILGVGVLTVQKWARNGRLKLVAGPATGCHRYLFRREDVERLRSENRLTAPQMAKRLGISRSQFSQWIKQGKVKPVSGPGVDECGQYLFEVGDLT